MLIGLGWLVEIAKLNIIIIIKYSKHSDMPKEIAAILLQQVRATVLGSGLRAQGYSQGLFWRFGLGGGVREYDAVLNNTYAIPLATIHPRPSRHPSNHHPR